MWKTPVPQLLLAIDGKMEFVGKTNPFGAIKKPLSKEAQENVKRQRALLSKAKFDARAKRFK